MELAGDVELEPDPDPEPEPEPELEPEPDPQPPAPEVAEADSVPQPLVLEEPQLPPGSALTVAERLRKASAPVLMEEYMIEEVEVQETKLSVASVKNDLRPSETQWLLLERGNLRSMAYFIPCLEGLHRASRDSGGFDLALYGLTRMDISPVSSRCMAQSLQ